MALIDPRISWGVELEFVSPNLINGERDPPENANDNRGVLRLDIPRDEEQEERALRRYLTFFNHSLAYTGKRLRNGRGHEVPNVPEGTIDPHFRSWNLDIDESITGWGMGFGWAQCQPGLEITSPVFFGDPAQTGGELVEYCSAMREHHRLQINESTGLHVHVGIGGYVIPFLSIQKLTTLVWITENLLFEPTRQTRHRNLFCRRLRPETPRRRTVDRDEGYTSQGRQWLPQMCWEDDDIRRIWVLDGENWSQAFYEMHKSVVVSHAPLDGKRTVEFRLMHGSLSPTFIINWARVCARLLSIAQFSGQQEFVALVERIYRLTVYPPSERRYSFLHLLVDLGFGEDDLCFWSYHLRRLHEAPNGPPGRRFYRPYPQEREDRSYAGRAEGIWESLVRGQYAVED